MMGQIVGSVLLTIMLFTGIGFASGKLQAFYNRTVGVEVVNSQTEMYHKNKSYTDGMAQDLSRYKLELSRTNDETVRAAIIAHINEEFANFDSSVIENDQLRQFLNDVQNGTIN